MDELEAAESLLACQRVALGSATLKEEAARSLQREWIRKASAGQRRGRSLVQLATSGEIEQLGIKIIEA